MYLWAESEGEEWVSSGNGHNILCQLTLLLILMRYGWEYIIINLSWQKDRCAFFRKRESAVLSQVLNKQVLPNHQDDLDLSFPSSKLSLNPFNPQFDFQQSKWGHWIQRVLTCLVCRHWSTYFHWILGSLLALDKISLACTEETVN